MSSISDLYPKDGVLAGAAMVVVAISITTAISLLISMLCERRPTVRHAVLASALFCSLATPLIAILIRTSGTSTFSWTLRPAAHGPSLQGADLQGAHLHDSGPRPDVAALPGNEDRTEPARARLASPKSPKLDATNIASATDPHEAPAQRLEAQTSAAATDAAEGRGAMRYWLTVAMIVWLAGSAILLVRIVLGSIQVFRICRSGKRFLADSRGTVAMHLMRCLGTKRLPTVLISDAVESPVATGVFRSAVILPAGLVSKISTDQLCDVLIHECAHVLRRDPLMLYLRLIAGSIFWPIPFVHGLNRQLNEACEEICDNYVLTRRNPLRYAETLLQVATVVGRTRGSLGFLGMLHWRGKLETRIAALIDDKRNRSTRTDRFRAGLSLIAFLLASVAICGTTIRAERTDPATAEASALPPAESASAEVKPKSLEKRPEPMQIHVWWAIRGGLGDAFDKMVKRFNDSQDRFSVEVRKFDGYGAVHKELNKAFREGDLPDVAVIEIHHVASFAADDRIAPLEDLIKNDPTFQAEDLLPGILTNLRYREKLYALPMNRSTPILYYNKDRFAAAGLDPNKPPATWQEVREMSVALTPDDQSNYGFVAVNSPWFFESMVWSNSGELLVDGKPTFAEFGAGPLQLWADMVHLDHTARFFKSGYGEFASGRAAMAVESTALLQSFASQVQFKLGTAVLPRSEGSKNAVPTGGGAAVIPAKNSPERQAAAWAFVSWFIKTQQAADWSEATGYIPIRESARAVLQSAGFYDQYPQFEVAIKQMAFAREAPQLPQWGAVWKIIEEGMTTVVRDDAPALRTLKAAEKRVETALMSPETPKP